MGDGPHARLLAGSVGELVGVSGTTIGQWARRGIIRSSQSDGDPRVYSVEDVFEAAVVEELLASGLTHRTIHRAIAHLQDEYGRWPLSQAPLAVAAPKGENGRRAARPRLLLRETGRVQELSPRGWQLVADINGAREVHGRLESALSAVVSARGSASRRAAASRRPPPSRRRGPARPPRSRCRRGAPACRRRAHGRCCR